MPTKIGLKQLSVYFHEAASNEELPTPIRRFAAQLTALVDHTERVDRNSAILHKHILELAEIISKSQKAPAPVVAPVSQPVVPSGPVSVDDPNLSDEERARMIEAEVMREAETEIAKAPVLVRKPPAQDAAS